MTNVNPGNGNRGNSGKGADRARDLYEEAADGSFDEAFEEFYDEPAAGRHRRVERVEDVEFEDVEGYADEPYDYASELEEEDSRGGVLAAGAMGASIAESDGESDPDTDADDGAGAGAGAVSSSAATGSGAALAGGAAAVSGVPKRGLAMILIAVAILLGLWGVYAMTQSGDGEGSGSGDNAAQEQQVQDQAQNQQSQNQNPAANRDPNSGAPADAEDQNNPDAADQSNNEPMTAENETVNVFNNSTVPNLAADVSGTLKDQGTRIGEVGNITEEQAVLTQNTVFFDPATPGAEERARVLAERVGGVAKPNDATVPADAAKPGSLTLVLTGPVGL